MPNICIGVNMPKELLLSYFLKIEFSSPQPSEYLIFFPRKIKRVIGLERHEGE